MAGARRPATTIPVAPRAPRTLRWAVLGSALTIAIATFAHVPSAKAACPNEALRNEDNSLNLPDCRSYELVSPAEKNGGAIQGFGGNFGGDVLQASSDGNSATFSSSASFGASGSQGALGASQYLARRGEEGWVTENITTPTVSGSYGDHPNGVPYQLFSPGLTSGLLLNGVHCRGEGGECPIANPPLPGSGAPLGYQDYYLRNDETGAYQALIAAAPALSADKFNLAFAGASPDLSHVVLSTCAALTPEATEQPDCESGGPNLYEWSGGGLRLINLLGSDTHGTSDAHLAAPSGAISSDGSRVYFTVGEEAELFLREGSSGAKRVSPAPAAQFQTASADGSFAFYTKGEELFRYDAATETSEPIATEVKGVLGASEDGSYLYYATAAGVFLWHDGTITEVAVGAAEPSDYPPATGTARVSADGTHLAFLSKAEPTGYDNHDQNTGEPDTEIFLYDATANRLTCASCRPGGEPPFGPSSIPGAVANGKAQGATQAYKPRDLSENGNRLFFDSKDVLAVKDANTHTDVYEWEAKNSGACRREGGCISLISGGQGATDAEFIDASADGSNVFFLTDSSLVAQDPGSIDLYDAREEGGFPAPPVSIECDGDTCQPLPPEPEDPAVGTAAPGAEGNPPVHFPAEHHHKPKRHRKRRNHKRKHHRASSHRGGHR